MSVFFARTGTHMRASGGIMGFWAWLWPRTLGSGGPVRRLSVTIRPHHYTFHVRARCSHSLDDDEDEDEDDDLYSYHFRGAPEQFVLYHLRGTIATVCTLPFPNQCCHVFVENGKVQIAVIRFRKMVKYKIFECFAFWDYTLF